MGGKWWPGGASTVGRQVGVRASGLGPSRGRVGGGIQLGRAGSRGHGHCGGRHEVCKHQEGREP